MSLGDQFMTEFVNLVGVFVSALITSFFGAFVTPFLDLVASFFGL